METVSELLTLCAGNSPVTGEFPAQRPVTRSLEVFFDMRLSKRLSKPLRGRWFETPSPSLWRHYNGICNIPSQSPTDIKMPGCRGVLFGLNITAPENLINAVQYMRTSLPRFYQTVSAWSTCQGSPEAKALQLFLITWVNFNPSMDK